MVAARSSRSSPGDYKAGHTYTLDGFSAEFPDWHFNVRALEHRAAAPPEPGSARPQELMEAKRDEVLALIRKA